MKAPRRVGPGGQLDQPPRPLEEAPLPFGPEERTKELATGVGILPEASQELVPWLQLVTHHGGIPVTGEECRRHIPVPNATHQPCETTDPSCDLLNALLLAGRHQSRPHGKTARETAHLSVDVVDLLRSEGAMPQPLLDLPVQGRKRAKKLRPEAERRGG